MIFYDAGSLESQFLKSVLDVKQIEYRTEVTAFECAIGDKEVLLLDLLPAVKYLDEKYPVPKLFSTSPEQNARLTMFVRDVLEKAYETGNYEVVFNDLETLPLSHDFIVGDQISIADLILYPILPDKPHWRTYKEQIKKQLDTIQ